MVLIVVRLFGPGEDARLARGEFGHLQNQVRRQAAGGQARRGGGRGRPAVDHEVPDEGR